MGKIKVVELFAGVGGFRVGLEGFPKKKNSNYEVVWSNQWEPATKTQHASDIYIERFGEKSHSNTNIEDVPTKDIPQHDLLCGGFPCQDYSVASTLKNSKGLIGKKGVLKELLEKGYNKSQADKVFKILKNQKLKDLKEIITGEEGKQGISELEELFSYLKVLKIRSIKFSLLGR